MKKYTLAQVKKAVVATLGTATMVVVTILGVSPGLIPVEWTPYINAFVAVMTVLGVFKAKNVDPPGEDRDELSTAAGEGAEFLPARQDPLPLDETGI